MLLGGAFGVVSVLALPFLLFVLLALMFSMSATSVLAVLLFYGWLVRAAWRWATKRDVEVPLSVLAPSIVREDEPQDVKEARKGSRTSLD